MEEMKLRRERKSHENCTYDNSDACRDKSEDARTSPAAPDTGFSLGESDPNRAPGVASRQAFGTAPKYPATHATCAVGNEGNGSLCQTRVCQPGWEHQGPRRLLDPHAGGRARRDLRRDNRDRVLLWELRRRSCSLRSPGRPAVHPGDRPQYLWHLRVVPPAHLSHGGEGRGL